MDLELLLRSSGRCASRDDPALGRGEIFESLFADRRGPRCGAATAARQSQRRAGDPATTVAGAEAAFGIIHREENPRCREGVEGAREETVPICGGCTGRSGSVAGLVRT